MDVLHAINTFAWVGANLLILYVWVGLLVFTIGYYALFDPKATTAGKFIFRFFISLVGVMTLVFIGIFLDPHEGREWWLYPEDTIWWRPIVRFVAYGYVAYAVTSLAVLIAVRKWWPEKLKTQQTRDLIKARSYHHED